MSEKVKILCVGIGGYANIYMRAFFADKNPQYEIVGAVDPFAEGAESYNKLKEIIPTEDVEVVITDRDTSTS